MPQTDSSAGHDKLIGRVVDNRFRIVSLLGSGGMGAVYLAEHVGIGKQVAIKVLRADLRDNRDLLRRFRREAMAVSKLADAHTITVFDYGVWKGLVYLVMEYLGGTDLAAVLDTEQRLSLPRCLRIAHQICSSLTEAHALGIVHRDLKPENIFLIRTTTGEERVKVLDFGLAKILRSEHRAETFETQKGALLGTPYYMAPEQIDSDAAAVSGRTDLYSLGALLFRMITGHFAFDGTTPVRVLEKHLTADLPAFASVAPELPVPMEVETLVRTLMARTPDDRPKNARATAHWIEGLLGQVTGTGPIGQRPPPARPRMNTPAARPDVALAATFSTSAFTQSNPTEKVPAEIDPGPPPLMRREFERYERGLIWKRRLIGMLWALLILGGIGAAVWYFVLRTPPPPTAEIEPNDEPRDATPIISGRGITGHIGRRTQRERSDRDVFVLQTPPGARVDIQVTGVPGIDLVIEGFTADSVPVFKTNTAGPGEGEKAQGIESTEARLYLVVRELWVEGQVPSENSTDSYRLTATVQTNPP
jgi:serine/threonine-protein kinase